MLESKSQTPSTGQPYLRTETIHNGLETRIRTNMSYHKGSMYTPLQNYVFYNQSRSIQRIYDTLNIKMDQPITMSLSYIWFI